MNKHDEKFPLLKMCAIIFINLICIIDITYNKHIYNNYKVNFTNEIKNLYEQKYNNSDIKNNKIQELLNGKNLSILGDSISTYEGYSDDYINTNDTLKDNVNYYMEGDSIINSVDKIWWKKAANITKMNILVNNSWSGSRVLEEKTSAGYKTRPENLHDNTGDNKGTNPDIIAIYIGINDFDNNIELGNYSVELYDKIITNNMDGSFTYENPNNFTEAYIIMLHKIINKYKAADVFCFTFVPNGVNKDYELLKQYNNNIKSIAKQYNIDVVDLYSHSGITIDNYYEFNSDKEGLHPNLEGMDAIAKIFVKKLEEKYINETV